MATNGEQKPSQKAIIGNPKKSFWLYDSLTGFDLTHPPTPTSATTKNAVRMQTKSSAITVDSTKSALVIVDMQNFFLSTALGRSSQSNGLKAQEELLQHAIPAARKAGMRIVWLNWGLTDEEIEDLPPSVQKVFGFTATDASQFETYLGVKSEIGSQALHVSKDHTALVGSGKTEIPVEVISTNRKIYLGAGNYLGPVTLEDGSTIEAGRVLCRGEWNTDLTPALNQTYQEGLNLDPPDVWIHKNRMSGLWGQSTACTEYLDQQGIKTLFFAGVNTDQCVGGSLTDAFSKGYDCILLSDGAATSSPGSCQEAFEYNSAGTYGFCMSCKDMWEGVQTSCG